MASAKNTFEPNSFESNSFACGTFRGPAVSGFAGDMMSGPAPPAWVEQTYVMPAPVVRDKKRQRFVGVAEVVADFAASSTIAVRLNPKPAKPQRVKVEPKTPKTKPRRPRVAPVVVAEPVVPMRFQPMLTGSAVGLAFAASCDWSWVDTELARESEEQVLSALMMGEAMGE